MEQAIDRAVDRVVERLMERLTAERVGRQERSIERSPSTATPAIQARAHIDKAEVLKQIQEMKVAGLSLQAIANRLNKEGVSTLSGKGRWQKGTIGNLLAR